jgi:hypothetical protein
LGAAPKLHTRLLVFPFFFAFLKTKSREKTKTGIAATEVAVYPGQKRRREEKLFILPQPVLHEREAR